MVFNLVEVDYRVFVGDVLLKEGTCPTFFINTLANLYLMFDNPSEDRRLEIILDNNVFNIVAPIC